MSRLTRLSCAALAAATMAIPAAAQSTSGGDRTIIIRGCVQPADQKQSDLNPSLLVWSGDNIILTRVVTEMSAAPGVPNGQPGAAAGTAGSYETVFYWLDNSAGDVAKHIGKTVEITGRMDKEFKKGEMEIAAHDNFTEVKFQAHGKEVQARVPRGFLGDGKTKDADYNVTLRDVDVKNVRVLSDRCGQ